MEKEKLLAVFMDIDNVFPQFNGERLRYVFDYLAGIGEIALCRGYADWGKLAGKKREALEWNVNTINLFVHGQSRKNAADIAITVDAVEELCTVSEITTFVIVSGDSDLAPLATKLRERGKEVIGISQGGKASPYLMKACTKFVALEDLLPSPHKADNGTIAKAETIKNTLMEIMKEKMRPGRPVTAGSLKNKLLEKVSDFREKQYGCTTFTQFLELFREFEVIRSATGAVSVRLARVVEKGKAEEEKPEEVSVPEEESLPLSLDEAQDVLIRAMKSYPKPDNTVDPSWLKSTMLRMAPRFSEKALGYSKFKDFLKAQKDLVKVDNVSPVNYMVRLSEK